jgi:uroporphyrinogen decarboxylase
LDFKERILTTMEHQEPDRVPVMGLIMDPTTVNLILEKKPTNIIPQLQKPVLKNIIKSFMNSNRFFYRFYYKNMKNAMEAALKLKFDANWTIYSQMKLENDNQSDLGMVWHDLAGRVWELSTDHTGNMIAGYARGFLPTEQKWNDWIESNHDSYKNFLKYAEKFHKDLVKEYGDKIYPIGYAGSGPFENSWQPIGFTNFAKYIRKKPRFIQNVIEFYTDFYIKYLDVVCKSGPKIVMGGDDIGHKVGPLMNPETFNKLYGESYKKITDFIHKQHKKIIWHTCGNIYEFLDYFIEWGFDGIITMEPTAGMDLGKVRKQVGHELVLVGNLDVSYLLVNGTKQEVENAVKKAIKDAAIGGSYILSACHSHPKVDPLRLKWMVEAAHKYGKYPIGI